MRDSARASGLTTASSQAAAETSPSSLHAIVAGAGIGGLMAALSLARAGLNVTVLERAAIIEETGAGLQLSPNCTGILREFGILGRLAGLALAPEALRIRRARDGAELARLPLGVIAEMRWGAPYLVALRADLQRALVERIALEPAIRIDTDTTITGFAATNDSVEIAARHNDSAIRLDADLLIGADGLHSIVRDRIGLGLADVPVYSGHTAWRALIDGRHAPPQALQLEVSLWLGHKAHLVHYPLRGGSLVNVVAITEDGWRGEQPETFWSTPGEAAALAQRFGRWHGEARTLIGQVKEWRRWPLFDRNPVTRWTVPRVAVLGDAAHPILPFLAQGAAQSIEDADALGRAFTLQRGNIDAALAAYEHERTTRAAAVQIASRRQGRIYHLPGPAAFARDLSMRTLGIARLLAAFDWLYRYRA